MTASRPSQPSPAPGGWSLLFTAAATNRWYDADETEKQRVLDRLLDVLSGWLTTPGCRYLTSFDDDLLMVGDPRLWSSPSIYLLFEVDSADVVPGLVDRFRTGDPRLDRYFTLLARLGRPFWPIEEARGRTTRSTATEEAETP